MPELPEVETIARSIAGSLVGRRVSRAHVDWKRTVAAPSAAGLVRRIVGQRVVAIGRRAKFVRIQLERDTLLIHLRMSGDLLTGHSDEPLGSHSRLQIYFEDGLQLSFQDPRKFGRVWLVADPESVLGALGSEPLDTELTPARFYRMLAAKKRQLKPLLLDQTFLAGLGNIYVDEALWEAKLHPLTAASKVSKAQAGALLRGIRKVLKEGIQRNGASIDWVYRGGEFQNHFHVYQRTGEKCPRCSTKIKRIVVGQRGTHFCSKCQKRG
ncbi:MAG: bifunctional DNA-formamidopyrimidine glycosylase/DNA-(apurinic or apyrimidinic site) lyase [Candidatus Omnitrophica bacterium]|nr:bifunctional DNA-formamidopyrimidine glycosylase/DNA-(apurinic or apyrimidinic site) lyase [Candidatus Omnitrophota bacterium]